MRVFQVIPSVGMVLIALAGCVGKHEPVCCDGGYEYRNRDRFAAEKTTTDLADRLAAAEKERRRLADELAASQAQNSSFSMRVNDLEQQLADRDRELASARFTAADGATLASQLSRAQSELEQSKSRVSDLERQLADRDRELASARSTAADGATLANQLSSAQSELERSKSRVNDLEQQLAERNRELASARSTAADGATLASQLSRAQSELEQSKKRVDDLERQLAASQGAAGDRDKLAAELTAAHSQVAALRGTGVEAEKQAADLTTARQRISELEAQLASAKGGEADKDKLAAELAAARQRVADLEGQLADRDRQLAALRGDLSAEMAKLKEAQRGLIRALRPQIDKNNITIDLNNERLLINLASGYLFGSGEDQLKPAGADALKHVGAILKDFPEYKVHVEGHTDNRPTVGELKKKFPSNQELSEARAVNAARALTEGGLSAPHAMGAADRKPVMPNTTDVGRARNRRVEITVTR
ncbi:MAG TPA: OmpA family protein [Nitrospira sp.]|nr:OmpA family protein [Nitrospira sp.]